MFSPDITNADSRFGLPQERTAGDAGSGQQQGGASNLSSLSPFDAASKPGEHREGVSGL
jgi:hypothetical protein